MLNSQIIRHPVDPIDIRFDFWEWRLVRRLVADRLRALADGPYPELDHVARSLEIEQLTESDIELVIRILNERGFARPGNLRSLFLALGDLTDQLRVSPKSPWTLPVIEPNWDQIPLSRTVFVGTVDGVRLRARLVDVNAIVPPYEIVWQGENGEDEERCDLVHNPIGLYPTYGKPVWDWLFARHLTLLCASDVIQWPDERQPPILIPKEWLDKVR